MRYEGKSGRVFHRKTDYVDSIIRACARKCKKLLLTDISIEITFILFFLAFYVRHHILVSVCYWLKRQLLKAFCVTFGLVAKVC